MSLSDAQLLAYDREGLIPAPGEGEGSYLARVSYCLSLKERFAEVMGESAPQLVQRQESEEILAEAHALTLSLYHIAPTWIPLLFSNYRLPLWEGGCAWIFQKSKEEPLSAFLQLRRHFLRHHRLLSTQRRELLAHEMAHVGRMVFEEPAYEELLAYRTSPLMWRRTFGPLFQSSRETLFWVLLLFFGVVAAPWSLWPLLASPFLLLLLLARLGWRHYRFRSALRLIHSAGLSNAEPLLYRLTDREIAAIGTMRGPETFWKYVKEREGSELRWRLLHLGYLKPSQ